MKTKITSIILGMMLLLQVNAQTWEETQKLLPALYSTYDYYGEAVAIDNNYIVVGSQYYNDDKGCAYILEYNGSEWLQVALLHASDEAGISRFGSSVSISGDVVVVGAYNADSKGAAYVFTKPESGWSDTIETAKLTASDAEANDYFGRSVSISKDAIVVGADGTDGNPDNSGSAYVFTKPVSGWVNTTESAILTASDAEADDQFGYSVSIFEDVILIGAHRSDDVVSSSGSAYIFTKPTIGWTNSNETTKLLPSDPLTYGYFGSSVSISEDAAVIGAYGNESAYVFTKPTTGWSLTTQTAKLTASNSSIDDKFGYSVSISGDVIIVGAYGHNDIGSAYVFTKQESTWFNTTETSNLLSSKSDDNDRFGSSVCISGDVAVVGVPKSNDYGDNSGCVNIYMKPDSGWIDTEETQRTWPVSYLAESSENFGRSVDIDGNYAVVGSVGYKTYKGCASILYYNGTDWEFVAKLTPSDSEANDYFGIAVSISGDVVLVGAYKQGGTDYGAAYIFEKPISGWRDSHETAKLTSSTQQSYDYLGRSVNLSGDVAIVGAYGVDDYGSESGAAYIFTKPDSGWYDTTETAKFTYSGGNTGDRFGLSVAISGETAVVGAYKADNDYGLACIFTKPDSGWCDTTETAVLEPSSSGYFGYSVDICGDDIIVGAYRSSYSSSSNVGLAYLFSKPKNGWNDIENIESHRLLPNSFQSTMYLGYSVSISGDAVVLSSYGGQSRLYLKPADGWTEMTETKILNEADYYGSSISNYGGNILIGAFIDSDAGAESGATYAYNLINDSINPTVTCNEELTLYLTHDTCVYTVDSTELEPIVIDNSGILSLTNDLNNTSSVTGEVLQVGTTTINWTATDLVGNSSDCSVNVTIEDSTKPTLTCVEDKIIEVDYYASSYTISSNTSLNPSVSDNVGVTSLINDYNNTASLANENIPIGKTSIIWTATDLSGNSTECTYSLTITPVSGIENTSLSDLNIYPNPVNNVFYIDNIPSDIQQIKLIGINGNEIVKTVIETDKISFDLSEYSNGIYFITVQTNSSVYTQKIIKQ